MSTLTLDLEDVAREPRKTAPHIPGSETSRAAAKRIQKTLGPKQRAVLRLFAERDWTDNELIDFTRQQWRWSVNTPRARRCELSDLEFLADTSAIREGCTVRAITEAGRAYLEQEARDA